MDGRRVDRQAAERIGRNVFMARRRAGFSQEELGALAGLHRTEIGMVEQGERLPRVDTLLKLAALNPVLFCETRRRSASGHFAELVLRQNLRVDREDVPQDAGLVAVVFFGGGRGALIVCATKGVQAPCAMPPAVSAARGRFCLEARP